MTPLSSPVPQSRPAGNSAPDLSVSTDWLRKRAVDCEDCAHGIEGQLGPARDAADALRRTADGWEFAGSLSDMQGRWEDLNRLLCTRLRDGAAKFRGCADMYDHHEDLLTRLFHRIFG